MKTIIVGAGLGGFSAAVCLSKRGHQVQLLERRDGLTPQGGGINIRPGASRILRTWGLAPDLEAISTDTPMVMLRSARTGDIAQKNLIVDVSDHPDWGTTRQEVIRVLLKAAKEAGCDIRFGVTVTDVHDEPGKQASVELSNGSLLHADLIIAADGVLSRLRSKILPSSDGSLEPQISEFTFYGILVPVSELKKYPGTSRLYDQTAVNSWMGQGAFAVSRYNPPTGLAGLLLCIKDETDQQGLWDENGDIEYVRRAFKGYCSEIETALRLADSCDRWKLVEMPNLPSWTSQGGRVILLGDSAHAMHPNAGQGYSQIVEDIGVLEYFLRTFPEGTPVSQITSAWQEFRKPRVERIRDYATWNTRIFAGEMSWSSRKPTPQSATTSVRSLKNVRMDMNAHFATSAFLKWTLDYDAIDEARKYMKQTGTKL
ncbi:salicylate hydroxylase [Fusarium albosuccineum]|uniref:Salicylate hydroxylase n=1 Tax=Fusarium albosuccineum TaxID=1237068 RepID=A0A8H4NTS4_9HYPO|nr:salicylate hydroxylase [Fusarium albosuccineum]